MKHEHQTQGTAADAVGAPVEQPVRPLALAEALRGIADGFDQQRPWLRPDELVMRTLRRAADELERSSGAVAAERERCAKLVESMDTAGHDGYIETTGDLLDALAGCIRRGA